MNERWQTQIELFDTPATARGDMQVFSCQRCGSLIATNRKKSDLGVCSGCQSNAWMNQPTQVGPFHPAWAVDLVRSVWNMTREQPGVYPQLEASMQRAKMNYKESTVISNIVKADDQRHAAITDKQIVTAAHRVNMFDEGKPWNTPNGK